MRKRWAGWSRRTARKYAAYFARKPPARQRAPLPPVSRAVQTLETMRRPQAAVNGHVAMPALPNFAATGGHTLEAIE